MRRVAWVDRLGEVAARRGNRADGRQGALPRLSPPRQITRPARS